MNAKALAKWIEDFPRSNNYRFTDEEWRIILRALRLLAAAEANDGTTPETDVEIFDANQGAAHTLNLPVVDAAFARQLERERNGLAAKVGELEADAERYQFLRDSEGNLLALMEEQ